MTQQPDHTENIVAMPPPEPALSALLWKRDLDEHENTIFLALSHARGPAIPTESEPAPMWCVSPVLRKDAIRYTVRHSDEALVGVDGEAHRRIFDDARTAQEWCECEEAGMGGIAPAYAAPEAEESPLACDQFGFAPTHKILAKWSRNGGILYLYRVWAKPDDPTQTQERELDGDEYEAALVGFVRQKLLEQVAMNVVKGWRTSLEVSGPFGRFVMECEVDFLRVSAFTWHRPEVLKGNVSPRLKEISMTVQLDPPPHESVVRTALLMERKHQLEIAAKAEGKSEEQLRSEIAANAAAAGITGDVLPVTLEDMQHAGINPTKPLK